MNFDHKAKQAESDHFYVNWKSKFKHQDQYQNLFLN
jgi:hypothetical protein